VRHRACKGIIFDFGGVFTKTGPRARLLRHCEEQLGLPRETLLNLLFSGEHWWATSTGKISSEEYWHQVTDSLGGSVPAALEPFKDNPFAYEALNRRMITLARRLHRRYKIALLSNATPYLDVLLAQQRLTDIFDVVVNSARVGMRKPDPAIYRLTLSLLGLEPAQCLFVDDKERNTQVAEALGMAAIPFRSAAHLARQLAMVHSPARGDV
jgi:epoxide hydrolase-like predicted phosphatase